MSDNLTKWKKDITAVLDKAGETTLQFGFFESFQENGILSELARGDVSQKALDLFFSDPSMKYEIVSSYCSDTDYSWVFYNVYQLTKVFGWGKDQETHSVYVKFSGYGRSHGGEYFDSWSFVEPKVKTMEVFE